MGTKLGKNKAIFLNQVYNDLDYKSGDLVDVDIPRGVFGEENYLSKGQWIETCNSINRKTEEFKIDRIFFIQDNPVVVFVDATTKQKGEIFQVFNSVWSLARPRIVFIEHNTSISVYDLASIPAKSDEELQPLAEILKESKQILKELKKFDRESIESGLTFGDKRFDTINNRADQTLINDLKQARKQLFEQGLNGDKLKYAHALIGRSIFIRYLEDRGVLTKDYFKELAEDNIEELKIIETPLEVNFYREGMKELIYPRVLSNKKLTFKLFKKIAEDFNGDTFSTDTEEENIIQQSHLDLLQNFLLGAGNTDQLSLFLWAYRFDIIPIDLISSIYEEFYHSENLIDEKTQQLKDSKGTHYTPSSLVEFVLSRTLTVDVLKSKPRILDPACGSGIFLVESFRRIVRYELFQKQKESLNFEELTDILRNQIAGIEINPEAIKISAFSLYLSVLNYLNPPNILDHIKKGGKLPYLINHGTVEKNHFNILLKSNTFNKEVNEIFASGSFDVIVGNPPWGTPSTKNIESRKELQIIVDWCDKANVEFPDKEPSHAFLWRALDFLKPNGLSALLVSSGVLLKFSDRSNVFKQQLLNASTFQEVINFSHVRRVFFSGAISPFILIKAKKSLPTNNSIISYLSLRKSKSIEKNKVVLMDKSDFKRIKQSNTQVSDIWKIHYWGNDYDFNLIQSLRRFNVLKKIADLNNSAQGFKEANKSKPSEWLFEFKEIPVRFFDNSYQYFDFNRLDDNNKKQNVPPLIEARGNPNLYKGKRILIRRGIVQKNVNPKGQIIARLEQEQFAYRHSIICIKLNEEHQEYYETVVGILWSSLFRYYMFMTASTWGTWRQEIHLNEVLEFPIAFPSSELKIKISQLVNQIHSKSRSSNLLENTGAVVQPLINELNLLIFELYELTEFERNLIVDRCNFTIDYYYKGEKSFGEQNIQDLSYFNDYIQTFKSYWQRRLDKGETLSHTYLTSQDRSMIGIAFRLTEIENLVKEQVSEIDISEFHDLVEKEISQNVFTEGLFRRVTSNDQIIIIKRNRKSNWTQTEAKIDADATFLQIFEDQSEQTSE